MLDLPMHWTRPPCRVTTDRAEIDLDAALALLHTTAWSRTLSREVLQRAVADSLTFALCDNDRLVGFARVVTDRATYGYVTDVVVESTMRGRGLGQWLMECVVAHPDLQGLRRLTLLTVDAQTLYERCGFVAGLPDDCHVYMERR